MFLSTSKSNKYNYGLKIKQFFYPMIVYIYLGEQLLTEVNALLKRRLFLAKLSKLGVWHILFLYAPISNPPSSAKTNMRVFVVQYFKVRRLQKRNIT